MKKIKLIKEYPGSPKLGSIADDPSLSENYPEYWKDVIEKEFEVLAIRRNSNFNEIFLVNEYDASGAFLSRFNINHAKHKKWEFCIEKDSREYIESEFHIYSVKRLSDGTVFTIGDRVTDSVTEGVMLRLRVTNNGLYQFSCEIKDNWNMLDFCMKYTVLFTTEKGENIFEGDECYFVGKSGTGILHKWIAKEDNMLDILNIVFFLTREAAEEYIYQNKPRFSFKDIVDAIDKSEDELLKPKWLFQRSICNALEKYCL